MKVTREYVEAASRKAQTALENESLTRARVGNLEGSLVVIGKGVVRLEVVLERDFWGRLRWLFLGR